MTTFKTTETERKSKKKFLSINKIDENERTVKSQFLLSNSQNTGAFIKVNSKNTPGSTNTLLGTFKPSIKNKTQNHLTSEETPLETKTDEEEQPTSEILQSKDM